MKILYYVCLVTMIRGPSENCDSEHRLRWYMLEPGGYPWYPVISSKAPTFIPPDVDEKKMYASLESCADDGKFSCKTDDVLKVAVGGIQKSSGPSSKLGDEVTFPADLKEDWKPFLKAIKAQDVEFLKTSKVLNTAQTAPNIGQVVASMVVSTKSEEILRLALESKLFMGYYGVHKMPILRTLVRAGMIFGFYPAIQVGMRSLLDTKEHLITAIRVHEPEDFWILLHEHSYRKYSNVPKEVYAAIVRSELVWDYSKILYDQMYEDGPDELERLLTQAASQFLDYEPTDNQNASTIKFFIAGFKLCRGTPYIQSAFERYEFKSGSPVSPRLKPIFKMITAAEYSNAMENMSEDEKKTLERLKNSSSPQDTVQILLDCRAAKYELFAYKLAPYIHGMLSVDPDSEDSAIFNASSSNSEDLLKYFSADDRNQETLSSASDSESDNQEEPIIEEAEVKQEVIADTVVPDLANFDFEHNLTAEPAKAPIIENEIDSDEVMSLPELVAEYFIANSINSSTAYLQAIKEESKELARSVSWLWQSHHQKDRPKLFKTAVALMNDDEDAFRAAFESIPKDTAPMMKRASLVFGLLSIFSKKISMLKIVIESSKSDPIQKFLTNAIDRNYREAIDILLEAGFSTDQSDLVAAVKVGNISVFQLLSEKADKILLSSPQVSASIRTSLYRPDFEFIVASHLSASSGKSYEEMKFERFCRKLQPQDLKEFERDFDPEHLEIVPIFMALYPLKMRRPIPNDQFQLLLSKMPHTYESFKQYSEKITASVNRIDTDESLSNFVREAGFAVSPDADIHKLADRFKFIKMLTRYERQGKVFVNGTEYPNVRLENPLIESTSSSPEEAEVVNVTSEENIDLPTYTESYLDDNRAKSLEFQVAEAFSRAYKMSLFAPNEPYIVTAKQLESMPGHTIQNAGPEAIVYMRFSEEDLPAIKAFWESKKGCNELANVLGSKDVNESSCEVIGSLFSVLGPKSARSIPPACLKLVLPKYFSTLSSNMLNSLGIENLLADQVTSIPASQFAEIRGVEKLNETVNLGFISPLSGLTLEQINNIPAESFRNLTLASIGLINSKVLHFSNKIPELPISYFENLKPKTTNLSSLLSRSSADQIAAVRPIVYIEARFDWSQLGTAQDHKKVIENLTPETFNSFSLKTISTMTKGDFSLLSDEVVKSISPLRFCYIPDESLEDKDLIRMGWLNTSICTEYDWDLLVKIGQVSRLPSPCISGLRQSQWDSIIASDRWANLPLNILSHPVRNHSWKADSMSTSKLTKYHWENACPSACRMGADLGGVTNFWTHANLACLSVYIYYSDKNEGHELIPVEKVGRLPNLVRGKLGLQPQDTLHIRPEEMHIELLALLDPKELAQIDPEYFASLPFATLSAVNATFATKRIGKWCREDLLSGLDASKLALIDPEFLVDLPDAFFSYIPPPACAGLGLKHLQVIGWTIWPYECFEHIRPELFASLQATDKDHVEAINDEWLLQAHLTASQLSMIPNAFLAVLDQEKLAELGACLPAASHEHPCLTLTAEQKDVITDVTARQAIEKRCKVILENHAFMAQQKSQNS